MDKELEILRCLTLIEMQAREAREARCHAVVLLEKVERSGIEVVNDPAVVAAVRGNGVARVGPSDQARLRQEAELAMNASMARIGNVLGMAGRLQGAVTQ